MLILRSEQVSAEADASIAALRSHALGPVQRAQVSGALHNDFSDSALVVQAVAQIDPRLQPAEYQVVAIEPGRVLAIESAYLRALFEAAWSGEASALLAGPAPEPPEVSFSTR